METPRQPLSVKCGRCGIVAVVEQHLKLDHFNIYRITCPHCGWPGRYVASELHPAPGPPPKPRS